MDYGNIEEMPDDAIGVYGFWCRGRCIYVGKTEDQSIRIRVGQEYGDSHNKNLKSWIKLFPQYLEICYLIVPHDRIQEIDRLETRLIRLWNPETNKKKQRKRSKQ